MKKKLWKLTLPVLMLCNVMLMVSCGASEKGTNKNQSRQYLFVQVCERGIFDGKQITLEGISRQTIFFTDRPSLKAGHIGIDKFVDIWGKGNNSFAASPPNASLSILDSEKDTIVVIKISNPILGTNSLTYTVAKVLEGDMPNSFGPASLFIDGGGLMHLVAYGAQD